MADPRIIVRLDERIEFERELGVRYRGVPRSRRQEWVRSVLRAGLAGLEGLADAPAQAAARPYVPAAAASAAPAPTPPVVLSAPAAPARPKPIVKSNTVTKSESLSGFFGETPSQGT
jgi:hypothetical protein